MQIIITTEWLEAEIDKRINPGDYELPKQTFFDIFEEFLSKHKLSFLRKRHYEVVVRALKRYELYKSVALDLDEITPDTLRDLEDYFFREYSLFEDDKYNFIFTAVEESRTPKPRGQNTINGMLAKLRTFILWSNDNEKND